MTGFHPPKKSTVINDAIPKKYTYSESMKTPSENLSIPYDIQKQVLTPLPANRMASYLTLQLLRLRKRRIQLAVRKCTRPSPAPLQSHLNSGYQLAKRCQLHSLRAESHKKSFAPPHASLLKGNIYYSMPIPSYNTYRRNTGNSNIIK